MIIADLDYLNTETDLKVSGGAIALAFANGSASANGNRVNLATTISLTSTLAIVIAAPRVYH